MIATRPRVLVVTRNLPPLVGGMERLNWHMAAQLSRYADVQVVGPREAEDGMPPGVGFTGVALRPLWKFMLQATWRAMRAARHWRPDVVLAGSGLTAPAAWLAARSCGARAAVYTHGLDLAVRQTLYRTFWLAAVRHMDRVICNSRATAELARLTGVVPARQGIVHPGVALPDAADAAEAVASARAYLQVGQRPVLLSVGRLSERKGLREFVEFALPPIAARHPDVLLLVVGGVPDHALHAQAQSPESISAVAARAGLAENLRFLGTIVDFGELAKVYRAADVHVFPVRELPGDPEGFGMVAIEAAAHNLPTVAFATGGIVDAVADGRSGYLVPPGDYRGLADAVIRTIGQRDAMADGCAAFARQFVWTEFGARLATEILPPRSRQRSGE